MFTAQDFSRAGFDAQQVADLANELKECSVPVRSCDPIQVWESHPVVSRFLDLRDRFIAQAIDAVNEA